MDIRTRHDLLAAGTTKRVVSEMHRILPGIYSDEKPDFLALCAAVTIWKPDAVFSHSTAAWIWGLVETAPKIVEATVPLNSNVRGPAWVTLYRRTSAPSTRVQGLPVVEIEHALLDVAVTMDRSALEALFDAAIGERVDWRLMAILCEESKGRHGMPAVREQLRNGLPKD